MHGEQQLGTMEAKVQSDEMEWLGQNTRFEGSGKLQRMRIYVAMSWRSKVHWFGHEEATLHAGEKELKMSQSQERSLMI